MSTPSNSKPYLFKLHPYDLEHLIPSVIGPPSKSSITKSWIHGTYWKKKEYEIQHTLLAYVGPIPLFVVPKLKFTLISSIF